MTLSNPKQETGNSLGQRPSRNQETYILAFSPHPDDADIGCGGLLVKTAQEGKSNVIIDLSPSQLSTRGNPILRQQEAQIAKDILGAHTRENLLLEDLNLQDDYETRIAIARKIRQYKPEVILFPYSKDRHPDHEMTAQIIKNALFVAGIGKVDIDGLPPHRPRLAMQYMIWDDFEPNIIIPLTEDQFQTKIKAFDAFGSQIETNQRASQYFLGRSLQMGWQIGACHGEGYILHQSKVGIDNLESIFTRSL